MKYEKAPDIETKVQEISRILELPHDISRVLCIRSIGSKRRHTIARCHSVSRAVQTGLGIDAHYVIEVLSENFDKLPEEEKARTLIHELMHIPKAFGGGFKGHRVVNRRAVERMYARYKNSL